MSRGKRFLMLTWEGFDVRSGSLGKGSWLDMSAVVFQAQIVLGSLVCECFLLHFQQPNRMDHKRCSFSTFYAYCRPNVLLSVWPSFRSCIKPSTQRKNNDKMHLNPTNKKKNTMHFFKQNCGLENTKQNHFCNVCMLKSFSKPSNDMCLCLPRVFNCAVFCFKKYSINYLHILDWIPTMGSRTHFVPKQQKS
jgi:hypothetical protein